MSTIRLVLSTIVLALLCSCDQKYNQGKVLYDFHCSSCHIDDGSGLGSIYPPLTKNDFLLENFDKIPCYIVNGMEGEIMVNDTLYDGKMPLIKTLSPVEITNILNYMNTRFAYGLTPIQLNQVMDNLQNCD